MVKCNTLAVAGVLPGLQISYGCSGDDNGVASYVAGTSPNGQAVISESALVAGIRKTDPWAAAATSGRAFSSTGTNANRLFEYFRIPHSGLGAAP